MNRLTIFVLAFAGANASILNKRQSFTTDSRDDQYDHLSDVCRAQDERGQYDMNLPCNQLMAIQYECMFGPKGGEAVRNVTSQYESTDEEEWPVLSFEAQRVCICESQHNEVLDGCEKCQQAHGGMGGDDRVDESKILPIMEKYCDASTPATQHYDIVIYSAVESQEEETSTMDSASAEATDYSDPIGNATDVSLYFTPSMTETAAYIPALPTPESSGGNITFTSSSTSGGLIVPTAGGSEREETSGGVQSSSGTASSDAGAMQTAIAHSGALGALGLAAMIAAM